MADAPDMSKYYYRPGTTEPELKPEFANAVTDELAAEVDAEQPELKGKLPEDFPGYSSLEAAGVTTYAKVRKQFDSLEEIEGIGPATAEKIREALHAAPDEEE